MEKLSYVSFTATTGVDDKECGVFVVEIKQNEDVVYSKGFGSVPDGDCHDDDSWHAGEVHSVDKDPIEPPKALKAGDGITVTTYLKETAGEVNITWDASLMITVGTTADRTLTWTGDRHFNTNTQAVTVDRYEMGRKTFD